MNIYFSGIGGVGIGPLAEVAYQAGYNVSGSDVGSSLMTEELAKEGIKIRIGRQDGSYLNECFSNNHIDLFVYTAALKSDHPELVLAQKLGIKTVKRDELINIIIKGKKLKMIAVAGTHGKTTTTSMLVWAFKGLGIPVSYSIGTTTHFSSSGSYQKDSDYFIYECDEFDRNFLHFHPFISLIPSVDYDHPDVYPTRSDYEAAFSDFANQSGTVITWQEYKNIFSKNHNIEYLDTIDEVKIPGEQNRRNASLAINLISKLFSIDSKKTASILESFPGVDRRFEKIATNLYTDYGHHPTEIKATLQLAREISDHVILVYQPHQNVRQHQLIKEYRDQFKEAEHIYWLPTYLTREDPKLKLLSPEDLIAKINNRIDISVANLDDSLWNNISDYRKKGYLVLIMGAGDLDTWVRDKLS
jgi:UDP-N-acetylmuramate--alanine ligase